LKALFVAGVQRDQADTGSKVSIALPEHFEMAPGGHVEVYKIDSASGLPGNPNFLAAAEVARELAGMRKKLSRTINLITVKICGSDDPDAPALADSKSDKGGKPGGRSVPRKGLPLEWWLKTDSVKTVLTDMPLSPDRFLLSFDKQILSQAGKIKSTLGRKARLVIWALPPLIMESELSRYYKQIALLIGTGFRSFQLGHISQVALFGKEKVQLFADYTFNLLNSQAMALVGDLRFSRAQAAIEMDRQAIRRLLADKGGKILGGEDDRKEHTIPVGLTVYGAPALYTSRLAASHFRYERQILSPKNEAYVIKKMDGCTQTFPERPFSLLPYLQELRELGVNYVVVDISGGRVSGRNLQELQDRLANTGRYGKLSTFNYLGRLE
jgi:putative protease